VARITGKDGYIKVNTKDLSGDANQLALNITPHVEDVTAFSDTADYYAEGKYNWTIDMNAYYNSAANQVDATLFGCVGAGAVAVEYGAEGSGGQLYTGNAILSDYSIDVNATGGATVSASLQGVDTLARP